jgi:hypothetical protein
MILLASINAWLAAGAALSAIAAVLHVCIIFGGAAWYRFFGAGERMALAAERRSWRPTVITAGIALVLFAWSAYALSGAGIIPELPMRAPALSGITAVYLLRGLILFPAAAFAPKKVTPFVLWSSLVCLGFGVVHFVGLAQAWAKR